MDAVLLVGEVSRHLIGAFEIYVGYDSNYVENRICEGGPYLTHDDITDPNGVEVWCGLWGDYITIVREPAY